MKHPIRLLAAECAGMLAESVPIGQLVTEAAATAAVATDCAQGILDACINQHRAIATSLYRHDFGAATAQRA
ncbi:hypothetical protein [Defluviicoccus vanus]|uniref:Uncharacterized protein n=1 Tax=Defluviicoccus vanus TaxID=111831 RepID=A0A7H1N2K6_9PROT|nr:hypothetical protein [Defluviicoccus vanus]QNT69942.1 hypothetical protein HQ394_12155 [Defluviicoccus vanus]